jgi:PPE-repeat protein
MDYGAEIPEVNSSRIYTGAGSGPLMATAAAWEAMAAELTAAAAQFASVIATLTTNWMGPSADTMVAALMPYEAWLVKTAATALQTFIAHTTAAAAHEAAWAGVVPPPVIAANRATLATLVATNFLGVNTPAIAATEAQYGEMWAQDASTLYTYADSMAALTGGMAADPFTPALPTSDPAGPVADAASEAVGPASNAGQTVDSTMGQMASMPSGMGNASSVMGAVQPMMSAIPSALQAMGSGASGANPMNLAGAFGSVLPMMMGMGANAGAGALGVVTPLAGVSSASGLSTGVGNMPVAAMGRATSLVGNGRGLSVPASWADKVEAPRVRLISAEALDDVAATEAAAPVAGVPPVGGMTSGLGATGTGGPSVIARDLRGNQRRWTKRMVY